MILRPVAQPATLAAMAYERYFEAVDYLQRRLWHELPIVPIERALQTRILHLLEYLGTPHRAYPVLHVAGSAGKGSTSTIAAAVLQASGLRTGLYTSPHLQTFIERVRVADRFISPARFAEIVLGLEPLVRRMHTDVLDGIGRGRPSLVEVAFAAGLRHFADERCDAAVIEAGLGGRTDCTNVFEDAPAIVITNIDYEHRERLGWTLASIAGHKAAIIRGPGVVVTATATRDALAVIDARCRERGATLLRHGRQVRSRITSANASGSTFDLETPYGSHSALTLPLAGAHQVTNAALAVTAAEAFAVSQGKPLGADAIRAGLGAARLSCRLETVQRDPLVLLDAAHNPAEARRLAEALHAHWLRRGRKAHLVIGILADKDQIAMVRALAPIARRVTITQPPLWERTGDPERLIRSFSRAIGAVNVTFEQRYEAAFDAALADARRSDIIVVTGSMFLVGALRERWMPERAILRRRSAIIAEA
jgi:dihydrofolate synthase/folylpolyglutamate synthase